MTAQTFVVGRIADFPEGSRRICEVGGRSIGIFNVGGTLYALHNLCPHALAPVCLGDLRDTALPSGPGEFVYGMEGYVLRCPWHHWEYDIRTGEALFNTDRRRIATFPVTVVDGQAVVTMRPRRDESVALSNASKVPL